VFTAEPGPAAEQLEQDAATLFNGLEPLIEVLNVAGYELLGAAWSPTAVESDPVTYVSFETMLARAEHATWRETVGVTLPAGSSTALALRVEPRIASGYTPPLADPAELTYALGLDVTAARWITSRQQPPSLSTVLAGWLIHVPDRVPGTLGAAVDVLGPTRPQGGASSWIGTSDLGALVSELSLQVFDSWTSGGGGGMLRMLLPQWWEVNPRYKTAELITKHVLRELFTATGRFNDRVDIDGTPELRGAHFADVLSWPLDKITMGIRGLLMMMAKKFGEDLAALYGAGSYSEALAEMSNRFTEDPLVVDVMVLLSTGLLSLKSRDPRWYVDPAPGAPRIGEEPFPAPIEPSWSTTDVTGFYQIVLPLPEVAIPDVLLEDSVEGPPVMSLASFAPAVRPTAELDAVFDSVSLGVEMLQVNHVGSYVECQWQGRSPNLTTDWDGDGVTEVHRIGVVHGTISAKLDPSSDPAAPAFDGTRRMPAATTPGGTDVVHDVRLEFRQTESGNMTVTLIATDENWAFTRQRAATGGEIVDIHRAHLTDRQLFKAPAESRRVLWGSDRAPLHTSEVVLLLFIAAWIVDHLDDATPVFGTADVKAEVAAGVPALMAYFGSEQHAYAAVQLRYMLENKHYHGGVVGSMFGDEQNYWQALLVAIHETGEELPELLAALGITQADIDAVLAVHHRYDYSHGTSSFAALKSYQAGRDAIKAGKVAEAAWEAIKLGAKAVLKVLSGLEVGPDVDVDFVTFTFNKLRLKNPNNPNSGYEVDDEAHQYPAVLHGLQVSGSFGLSAGLRWSSFDDSTVIKTGRDQWLPIDWAGPYVIFQIEAGVAMLMFEEITTIPIREAFELLGFDHNEGKAVALSYFYRWPPGATVPETAWALDESWIENAGLFVNIGSIGLSIGWLCAEGIDWSSPLAIYEGLADCLSRAQVGVPPLVEQRMHSGDALTATATAFRANASRLDDFGEQSAVDELGSYLAKNLDAFRRGASSMLVHGHASPDGSELHNRCLSERRVEYVLRMVAAMLGADFGIDPGRIEGLGLGEYESQDYSVPNDPTWRVVELAVNSAGMSLVVESLS
jgi:hypothetical protein